MKNIVSSILSPISLALASVSWVDTFDSIVKIVAGIMSIIISLLSLYFLLKSWYSKAMEDKKISKEEIKEAEDIIKDNVGKVVGSANEVITEIKKDKEDKK